MSFSISVTINGIPKTFKTEPNEILLDLLRREGYVGAKSGCREGTCGACTIIMDGEAVYSCILYTFQADGRTLWTIEGVGTFEKPHPFQQALVEEGAVQCGFCIPGMVLAAKALLEEIPNPDDDTTKQYMDGNLCRCTGYEKIWAALKRVIDKGAES